MVRKDKKPEVPPPSPSDTSESEFESDTDTDTLPPTKITTTPSTNPSTSSEHDDTASDSDPDNNSPPPKPSIIPKSSNQQDTVSSSDDDEDEDEDEDDDENNSPPPKINIIPSKRPAENNIKGSGSGSGPEKKKPKKDNIVISALPTTNLTNKTTNTSGGGSGSGTAATTPHKLFQRVWSDEDEIVILKGMIDFKANKGIDPMSNVDDFLEFIKRSLKVADANKAQIVNKVRRLKTKFHNAKKKKSLTNPHEVETFKLSKQIWGDDTEVEDEVRNPKVEKDDGWVIKKCGDVVEGKEIDVEFGFLGEDRVIVKEAMRLMEGEQKRELKKKVKIANLAYMEAYLMRLKVMDLAAKKVLDDIRK